MTTPRESETEMARQALADLVATYPAILADLITEHVEIGEEQEVRAEREYYRNLARALVAIRAAARYAQERRS